MMHVCNKFELIGKSPRTALVEAPDVCLRYDTLIYFCHVRPGRKLKEICFELWWPT